MLKLGLLFMQQVLFLIELSLQLIIHLLQRLVKGEWLHSLNNNEVKCKIKVSNHKPIFCIVLIVSL